MMQVSLSISQVTRNARTEMHITIQRLTFFSNIEYSKLSMGPLWAEIMDHIDPVLQKDSKDTQNRPRTPAKLAIYSGYDSTIMEVLASLGAWSGQEWPPYASMILLEVRAKKNHIQLHSMACVISLCASVLFRFMSLPTRQPIRQAFQPSTPFDYFTMVLS